MKIDKHVNSNEPLTVEQLMQSPFETGSLIVDFSQNQVTLDGEDLILQPKVLELLIILCAANGKTLSKQELIETLWTDTVVGPDSLANTMTRLRKILKDDAKNPQFIKTVQRKGYLWIPSVLNLKVVNQSISIKKIYLLAGVLIMGALLFVMFQPKPKPKPFPFPDLSIQKLAEGGYEIEVGIEGELTEEKEAAMLAELKRITGEEHSDMEFTVDEITPACINKVNGDKVTGENGNKHCEKKTAK
ncbi:MAG: winged helix-turn-helix transcriptional regulator [Colwellia sp.]|nr:winged helix-turn-helix transcriptional regulator [Colwellia sp.]